MWKKQTGKIVDTGIEGTGTTSDHWKYLRKELQNSDIVVPIRIQADIDLLSEGLAQIIRK
jgi:hypothetical protein